MYTCTVVRVKKAITVVGFKYSTQDYSLFYRLESFDGVARLDLPRRLSLIDKSSCGWNMERKFLTNVAAAVST